RQRQLDEQRYDDDQSGVDQRPVEDRVAEQLDEVVEPDEIGRRLEAVPVEEGVPAGLADRQDDEDGEEHQRRRQEDERGGQAAAGVARSPVSKGLRQGHLAPDLPVAAIRSRWSPDRKGPETVGDDCDQRWSHASWIAAAPSSGVISPAAIAT